jgi:hypothetical protein
MDPLEEPGLRIMAKLGSAFYDDPAVMFAAAAAVTVGLTTWTIYQSVSNFPLAICLYVLSASWQGSFNGVRQFLACAIVFAGHRFILERRFTSYLAVVLFAALFHISALVLVLLYWVPRRQLGAAAIVLLFGAALIAVNSYGYLGEVVGTIKEDDIAASSYFLQEISPFRILLAFLPSMIYLCLTRRDLLAGPGHFYANIMYVHGLVMLAAVNSAYIARFAIYTGVYISVAIPALLNMRDRRDRALVGLAVLCVYGAFWFHETSTTSALSPFHWLWERRSFP